MQKPVTSDDFRREPSEWDMEDAVQRAGKVQVVMSEQHSLLPTQRDILVDHFGNDGWAILPVPATGWTAEDIVELDELTGDAMVFVSPIPLLIALRARRSGFVGIFHNDRREAVEVDDGKGGKRVIHRVSPDGWQLIYV